MAKAEEDEVDGLTAQLGIRVAQTEIDRLDDLVERIGVMRRHAIARIALRIGIEVLEKDPSRVLGDGKGLRRRGHRT